MSDVRFQQLFPTPGGSVDAASFLTELAMDCQIPPGRPLVMANMVSTLDGNTAFDGRSSPLSDPGDRVLFHALRGASDAIMAGTATLRVEKYHPAGKPVVTMTRSGALPLDIPLFRKPEGEVIVFSAQVPDLSGVGAKISLEPFSDLHAALATLHSRYGIRILLCEGGPRLFGAMLRAKLVDELFLTLSSRLAGGTSGPAVTSGTPAAELLSAQLGSVLELDGTLYLRYRLIGTG